MTMKWLAWVVPGLLIGAAGCPSVDTDTGEGVVGPTVEFDPANSIVPFPNNLALSADGLHVSLPEQCDESPATTATRVGVLNKLDGFGTYEVAMQVTFSEDVDPATLNDQTIVFYKRASGLAGSVDAPSAAIPLIVIPGMTLRRPHGAPECGDPVMVSSATIVPRVPLDQLSFYTAGVLKGVKTMSGADYQASFTWSLLRLADNPVQLDSARNVVVNKTPLDPTNPEQLAQLQGINLLWSVHAKAVAFLESKGHARSDILVAWEFRTQTTTDPLDPSVSGSPAAMLNTMPLTGPIDAVPVPVSITAAAAARTTYPYLVCTTGASGFGAAPEADNTQCYLKLALGGGLACSAQAACEMAFAVGTGTCSALSCTNISDVLAGRVVSKQYMQETPNAFDPTKPIPGAWSSPIHPAPVKDEKIGALIFVPAGTPPAGGWPTVIYQHGLGLSNTTAFALAPSLAKDLDGAGTTFTGLQTVAIDAVNHGSRAVRIRGDAECAGTPSPSSLPECFAPIVSLDLGALRDSIRQTVLDQQQLLEALKACGTTACGAMKVDPAHLQYVGMSLGGILGGIFTAVRSDLTARVLNVATVGLLDSFEGSQTNAIRCLLVDPLIDAGVLTGDKWNNMGTADDADDTGLCTTDAWKTQAGYLQFSVFFRWILDPGDPANFMKMLAPKKVLLQEVVGDAVLANVATNNEGALLGLTAMDADPFTGTQGASAAITTNPTANKFVKYNNLPANSGTGFPGNSFTHGSILKPATGSGTAGALGTGRVQTDVVVYLHQNL